MSTSKNVFEIEFLRTTSRRFLTTKFVDRTFQKQRKGYSCADGDYATRFLSVTEEKEREKERNQSLVLLFVARRKTRNYGDRGAP